MSVRLTESVHRTSTLRRSSGAFRLVWAIAERASDDGIAWPGKEELKTRIGCESDRHYRRCVSAAIEAGELERRVAGDGRIVWRLTLEGLDAPNLERLAKHGIQLTKPFGTTDTNVLPLRTKTSAKAATRVRPTRARALSEGTVSEPSPSGGSTPDGATAQKLVAFFVDESVRRSVEPLKSVRGQIARGVKAALDEGCTADEIRTGLRVVISKGLHPSTLASCIKKRPAKGDKRGTRAFAEYDLGA